MTDGYDLFSHSIWIEKYSVSIKSEKDNLLERWANICNLIWTVNIWNNFNEACYLKRLSCVSLMHVTLIISLFTDSQQKLGLFDIYIYQVKMISYVRRWEKMLVPSYDQSICWITPFSRENKVLKYQDHLTCIIYHLCWTKYA